MADQDSAQDRNLPASAKKIERSRADGMVPRSRDLQHFVMLATAGVLIAQGLPALTDWLRHLMAEALSFDNSAIRSPSLMGDRLLGTVSHALMMILPAGGMMCVAAVAGQVASGGWNFTLTALEPKFSHLDPLAGIGRLFRWQGLGQALKAVALALVLGAIGTLVLKDRLTAFVGIMSVPLPSAIAYAGQQLMSGLAMLGLALALFAVIDVPLQRQLWLKRLKMSRQEVKQEHKETEGNQEVKNKRRQRMREMAKRRMLAAVPKADLVVMNPTHYAVALRYDEKKSSAPIVVAKGADLLAMKIRDVAKESKVPVLQSPMLARALFAHAEVDREIPAALFAAVAQVLAYVFQLRAAMIGKAKMPTTVPDPQVPPELDPLNKPVGKQTEEQLAEFEE